jgi:alpha-L-fucosidase
MRKASIAAAFSLMMLLSESGAKGEAVDDGIIRPSSEPNAVQRQMIARRYGMFIHFGINTFHDQEWTDGSLPASSYAPTGLDTDQWVRTAKDAGMKYVIFTSKHHDGFCLWDSPLTTYDVGSTSATMDVVGALSKSCAAQGIGFGIYYSLWDRHEKSYPDDTAYVEFMKGQLRELLTNYGPVCELWLDGGWEKKAGQWNIPALYALAKSLQPSCAVSTNWTIGLPDNPEAHLILPKDQKEGYPFRYFPSDFRLGDPHLPVNPDPKLFSHEGKKYYLPFESTVCLNDRWFYNTTDKGLKSVEDLAKLYETATSQDNILILNSPPDRSGKMQQRNIDRLKALRAKVESSKG